jgi:hypothetical protein
MLDVLILVNAEAMKNDRNKRSKTTADILKGREKLGGKSKCLITVTFELGLSARFTRLELSIAPVFPGWNLD